MGKELNVCATQMGWLFQRQSDKQFPRTKFSKGVMKGKSMAHKMTGVILVLVAAMRSTKGCAPLLNPANTKKQIDFFPNKKWVYDWILLLETQLQFEAWLNSPSLTVEEVKRAKVKVREVMNLTKQVGKQTKGMGFSTMNFHAILHAPDDILNFGVPTNVNARSDEMHHKKDKKSAKRTQKRPKTFDIQSLQRIEDRRVIEFGMEELAGRRCWDYYRGIGLPTISQNNEQHVDKQPKLSDQYPKLSGPTSTTVRRRTCGCTTWRQR